MVLGAMLESPRWLVSKHRVEEARDVLLQIYGQDKGDFVGQELEKLSHQHRQIPEVAFFSGKDLWKPGHLRPLLITCALKFIQQLTGTSIIVSYMVVIFTNTGASLEDALLFTALSSTPQLLTMILGSCLLDSLGRKALLMTSLCGVIVTLFFIGLFQYIDGAYQTVVMVIGVIAFRLFYSLGMGPIPLVLSSEILPFAIRGKGLAVSTLLHSTLGFMLTAAFPGLLRAIGPAPVYWALCLVSLGGLFFIQRVVKETKNLTLEDIETMHLSIGDDLAEAGSASLSGSCLLDDLESSRIDGGPALPVK